MNPRLARLTVLVGTWEQTAAIDGRVMSTARTTFDWLADRAFLVQRVEPPSHLDQEWSTAAPRWVDAVIGVDDYSDLFTMLYSDSRGVCRTYRMSLDGGRWTMSSRPGQDFHQRFEGVVNEDGTVIEGRWEASEDGQVWRTDFTLTYRRLN